MIFLLNELVSIIYFEKLPLLVINKKCESDIE